MTRPSPGSRSPPSSTTSPDCDLVIEAVLEEPDVKREVFAELDRILRPDAILATNTSALSVTELAAASGTPERVVGMHFFNPAPLMPLVEVVRTELTSTTRRTRPPSPSRSSSARSRSAATTRRASSSTACSSRC